MEVNETLLDTLCKLLDDQLRTQKELREQYVNLGERRDDVALQLSEVDESIEDLRRTINNIEKGGDRI